MLSFISGSTYLMFDFCVCVHCLFIIFAHLIECLFPSYGLLWDLYSGYKSFISYMIFRQFPSQWLVFILLTVSLEEQKVFLFRKYNLLICLFMDCGIDFLSMKFLPNPGSQGLSLVFSSTVFVFMFRLIMYLELSFVYGTVYESHFMVVHMAIHFSKHHLLKRLFFVHKIAFVALLSIICSHICGSIFDSSFCSFDIHFYLHLNTTLFLLL